MAATLYPNRTTALAALWWLFEGASFVIYFADTTGATTQPSYDTYEEWLPYLLSYDFDLLVIGGTAGYDQANSQKARLPQIEIVLDYNTSITYTHMIIEISPAINPGSSAPITAYPILLYLKESPAVTVASTETKTYKIDLTALFS